MEIYTFVEKKTCIACGLCGMLSPNVFDYDENGLAFSLIDGNKGITKINEKWIDDTLDAYEQCPSESIKISYKPFI